MSNIVNLKNKIRYYDNLRAFACFLVILSHSPRNALDPSFGIYMVIFTLISSPSSELFVSISSSLIAPAKLPMLKFYKKRFSKLLWPFLFWSVFMVSYRFFMGQIDTDTAINRILFFPLKPTEGPYWFVYAICALYLINPIISPWLEIANKKEFLFVIGLWIITLILPYLNIITGKEIYLIRGDYYSIFSYVGGFAGYMLIGVYLRKFPIFIENKIYLVLIVTSLLILGTIPIAYAYFFNRSALLLLNNNLSLTSAFYVSAIFLFFKNFKFSSIIELGMSVVAKYSFGIYLIHILIVREVIGKFIEHHRIAHPLVETPFIAISSLVLSLFIVKLLSYLPGSKYFIGS